MKIKSVHANNYKKCLEIKVSKNIQYDLPFSQLRLIPTQENKIENIYIDEELGNQAITYQLKSGKEDTVHLDAFLDYNQDPDFMKKSELYHLTLKTLKLLETVPLSKREIARKLKTSLSQLYRLLDTANSKKSIDQMFRLICVLNAKPQLIIKSEKALSL